MPYIYQPMPSDISDSLPSFTVNDDMELEATAQDDSTIQFLLNEDSELLLEV